MEILYRVHTGLYVNLTNQCSSACTFCLRQSMDHVGESHCLWLEREPTAQEVKTEFEKWDLSQFTEIVFCGFGEPTCALPVLLEVAAWLKSRTTLPIRVNTNGQGSLIAGRDITGELAKCVDTISVSLNDPDPVKYQALVRSKFGERAFPGMLEFAKGCVAQGIHVVMTTVDTTITHQEEAQCRKICQDIGADYRIRPWED